MEGQNIHENLKRYVEDLKALLLESENATRQCKPEIFEKFFFSEKQSYCYDGVKKRFDEWMFDNLCPGIEKLRDLQALVVEIGRAHV